jgi:hypothetical protein
MSLLPVWAALLPDVEFRAGVIVRFAGVWPPKTRLCLRSLLEHRCERINVGVPSGARHLVGETMNIAPLKPLLDTPAIMDWN